MRGPSTGGSAITVSPATTASPGPGHGRRYRIIRNPAAGVISGIPLHRVSTDELRALALRHGLGEDVVETTDEAAAREAVNAAVAAGIDIVAAAGGDGTAGLVAQEILGTNTALGILPLGRVMNLARALGIPRDLDAAAAVIASGDIRTIDAGEATTAAGRRVAFFEGGSVGMNAAIFREAARFDDGDWASIARTIWVALRYRPARMRLDLDDRTVRTRALMATVSNGPYTGVGMTVAPGARLDDGRFDVRLFRGFSKWELLRHLAAIAFGRRRYAPHVSTYRSAMVRISSAHPLPARADGRDLGTTPVMFRTVRGALRVVVPPAAGDQPAGGGSSAGVSGRRRM